MVDTFFVEAVDLGDESALVISAEKKYSVRMKDLNTSGPLSGILSA